MPFDWGRLPGVLRGIASVLEDPERLEQLRQRFADLAKGYGKAAALQALEQTPLDDVTRARIQEQLEKL